MTATASLVSIVVPCYALARYLEECVGSVLAQTYGAWELIVVDDGSPDDCAEVAGRLIAAHPERAIRLLRLPNGGVVRARNAGIEAGRGAYLLPLDADDAIEPAFLERTVAALKARPDADFAYTDYRHFGASDVVVRCIDYRARALIGQNRFAYCTLYRRRLWEGIGGYHPAMAIGYEDWDFWMGAVERGSRGVRVPEVLFRYRVREGSRDVRARRHDAELKSRIVLHHSGLYPRALVAHARETVRRADGGDPSAEGGFRRLGLDLWLALHARDPLLFYRQLRDGLLGPARRDRGPRRG